MNTYRYILEPYKGKTSRHKCPSCSNKNTFTRYIDRESGEYLNSTVGRCDREINCGYHYSPKQYFDDLTRLGSKEIFSSGIKRSKIITPLRKPVSEIAEPIFNQSLKYQLQNNFIKYLADLFGSRIASELAIQYFIGSSKHWTGATVFWQVDQAQKVRTGKVILYDSNNGKRVKEPFNHIAWAHALLKLPNFSLIQCFFGEHLLATNPTNPIAIVESEKTAVIASVYMPQLTWLASGGINDLSCEKFEVLTGRKILLFPDLNGFDKWQRKALEIQMQVDCKISVSDLLEVRATKEEKDKGLDIADYLIKRDDKFGWALSPDNYPLFWDKKPNGKDHYSPRVQT